jgi:hypothetical protein
MVHLLPVAFALIGLRLEGDGAVADGAVEWWERGRGEEGSIDPDPRPARKER